MKTAVPFALVALLLSSCSKSLEQQANTPATGAVSNIRTGVATGAPMFPNPQAPITGSEVWTISGTNYSIQGTTLLTLGNGQTMFTINATCDFPPTTNDRPVARSIAKYAVDQGYTAKVKQSWWNGAPQQSSGAIGVSLIQTSFPGSSSPGYRYSFTLKELQ